MPTEGMVHALRRAHRLLAADGCLLDLRPTPQAAGIEVGDDRIGPLDSEKAQGRHAAAGAALAAVIELGLFDIQGVREFTFRRYGDSIVELRDYISSNWKDSRVGDALAARTREAARASPAAMLRVSEQVQMTKLRPR
jgi:hypothetical protein